MQVGTLTFQSVDDIFNAIDSHRIAYARAVNPLHNTALGRSISALAAECWNKGLLLSRYEQREYRTIGRLVYVVHAGPRPETVELFGLESPTVGYAALDKIEASYDKRGAAYREIERLREVVRNYTYAPDEYLARKDNGCARVMTLYTNHAESAETVEEKVSLLWFHQMLPDYDDELWQYESDADPRYWGWLTGLYAFWLSQWGPEVIEEALYANKTTNGANVNFLLHDGALLSWITGDWGNAQPLDYLPSICAEVHAYPRLLGFVVPYFIVMANSGAMVVAS